MAQGEEYEHLAGYAGLNKEQGVCVNCFKLIKEEKAKGGDSIMIAKLVTEKGGAE
jgi:hypothetical protein